MIILTTSPLEQALSVIPRDYVNSFVLSVTDDNTNVTETYDITNAVQNNDYLDFSNVFNPVLVTNRFYDLRLYFDFDIWNTNPKLWNADTDIWQDPNKVEIFYRDKVFCTDQEINQLEDKYYEINKNQYEYYSDFGGIEPIEEGTPEDVVYYKGSDNTFIVR
jgi:hypothetical protein